MCCIKGGLDFDDRIENLLTANGTLSIRLTERRTEVERLNRRIDPCEHRGFTVLRNGS